MRRASGRGYGGYPPRKPHIITNPEDGRPFAAAGACFYALHPTNQELHILLVYEGPAPAAIAPKASQHKPAAALGDLESILGGLSLSKHEEDVTLWNFPGGKRKEYTSETPLDAAVRKLEEETHWQLDSAKTRPLLKTAARHYVPESKYYLYLAELPDAWDLPDKIKARLAAGMKHPGTSQAGAHWMTLSTLKALLAQPNWPPKQQTLSGFVPEAMRHILKSLEAEEARRRAAVAAARERLVELAPDSDEPASGARGSIARSTASAATSSPAPKFTRSTVGTASASKAAVDPGVQRASNSTSAEDTSTGSISSAQAAENWE